ncbi:MAG: hypothetical protein R8P61_22510 [Bacteroidia bacterium]|nr:hypothetical protein [Bacteroidia bacterium]
MSLITKKENVKCLFIPLFEENKIDLISYNCLNSAKLRLEEYWGNIDFSIFDKSRIDNQAIDLLIETISDTEIVILCFDQNSVLSFYKLGITRILETFSSLDTELLLISFKETQDHLISNVVRNFELLIIDKFNSTTLYYELNSRLKVFRIKRLFEQKLYKELYKEAAQFLDEFKGLYPTLNPVTAPLDLFRKRAESSFSTLSRSFLVTHDGFRDLLIRCIIENRHNDSIMLAMNRYLIDLPQINTSQILFLSYANMQFGRELREIQESLKLAKERDTYSFVHKHIAKIKDLRRILLDNNPQILHFCQGSESTFEGLTIENNLGISRVVPDQALKDLINTATENLECIIFNINYLSKQTKAILQIVPYVIALQVPLQEEYSSTFSTAFYDSLGAGKDIEFSFEYAVGSLKVEGMIEEELPILLKNGVRMN